MVLLISEVLRIGKTSETDTGARSWGLINLNVNKGGFGSWATNLYDTGVDDFVVEIVTFTDAFTDTGEDLETSVKLKFFVMISMISTGLPAPAPPKSTIFPPLALGYNNSMTKEPTAIH